MELLRNAFRATSIGHSVTWNDAARLSGMVVAYNLPFWLLSRWVFIDRAVIDLDALVAILLTCLRPMLGVVAILLAWGVDAVVSQAMTYHFTAPWDFIRSAIFAGTLDWKDWVLSPRWLMLLPFLVSFTVLWHLMRRAVDWRLTVAVLVVLGGLDALNGSSLLAWRDQRITVNVAGSPTATLLYQAAQPSQAMILRPFEDPRAAHLQRRLAEWGKANPRGSMVVILVESMGQPRADGMRDWLRARMRPEGPAARHDIETTATSFRGATTSGELRTLCALSGNYRALSRETGQACLPAQLQSQGWTTIGLHGFTRRMFERNAWWPLMGLSKVQFAEDLLPLWPQCGATFKGVCDRALIQAAFRAAQTPRTFVYALTLGTHLPVPETKVDANLEALCLREGVKNDVCQLQSLIGEVLEEVRLQSEAPGTPLAVMVAGDHAPPFSTLASRGAFERDLVPVFLMLPGAAP